MKQEVKTENVRETKFIHAFIPLALILKNQGVIFRI